MSIEDILYEAEAQGLRHKVLEGVRVIREISPSTPLKDAYEISWADVMREQRT